MLRMAIACLAGGAILGWFGIKELRLNAGASATPQEISLQQLIEKGHGTNNFIILKDFLYSPEMLYKPLRASNPEGAWDSAWTPILVPGEKADKSAKFHAILFWPDVRSKAQYDEFTQQQKLKGMVINAVQSLTIEQKDLLKGTYPETDFEKCLIIEVGREPGGTFKIILFFAGAAMLLIGGIAGLIVRAKQKPEEA
jgi:hypothetical protein